MAKKPPNFEEAMARLESLADEIEQGKIGLEESIARYEEGMALFKHCRDILSAAELRISKLQSAEPATPAAPEDVTESGDAPLAACNG